MNTIYRAVANSCKWNITNIKFKYCTVSYCTLNVSGNYFRVVESFVCLCVSYLEQCWLYSLTAAGRKDLRYRSFTHLG